MDATDVGAAAGAAVAVDAEESAEERAARETRINTFVGKQKRDEDPGGASALQRATAENLPLAPGEWQVARGV